MKLKLLLGVLFSLCFLIACHEEIGNKYIVEGKISGLNSDHIYIVTPGTLPGDLYVDTITCSSKGAFIFKNTSDTLIPVILYFEEGTVWTTIWTKNGNKTSLSGDVRYPELLLAKGGPVNDQLSEFKEKYRNLLTEKRDLLNRQENRNAIDSLAPEANKDEYVAKIANIDNQLQNEAGTFIEKHPSSITGLILFQDYLFDSDAPQRNKEYLNLFNGEAKENALYSKFSIINENLLRTNIGTFAPDFSVPNINNKDTIRLSTFDNQYLLLSFSASWCDFCKPENDSLIWLRSSVSKKELGMLTISLDHNKTDWEQIVRKKNLDWYHAVDSLGWNASITEQYNVQSIPANFLIDKNKKIIGKNLTPDSIMKLLKIKYPS